MDEFYNALISNSKSSDIPSEYDWFAPLIGDWDFIYREQSREIKGEWFFRRVLCGMAIEDLFICPSRASLENNSQPDGEYGVAVRMFNKQKNRYDMTYICAGYTTFLEVQKENNKIICTVKHKPEEKWVFSKIEKNSFHWQNITVKNSSEQIINSDIYASRK